MLKKGDLIKVYWRDTFSQSGWWKEDEIKKTIVENIKNIETIGHFVMKYRGLLVVAQSKEPSKDFNPWGFWKAIPLGTITKICLLKQSQNKTK